MSTDTARFRSIFKATGIIGGATFIVLVLGMVKSKFAAVLIGPSGLGLQGMYMQVTWMVTTLASLGVGASGIREVAAAHATGDPELFARRVLSLRRTMLLTGIGALVCMAILARPLSRMTFRTLDHAWPLAILGLTILWAQIALSRSVVLQATGRLRDMAVMNISNAVLGALVSAACFWLWGEKGVLPSLVATSLGLCLLAWRFGERVPLVAVRVPWATSLREAKPLLVLGSAFMFTSINYSLAEYAGRLLMVGQEGLRGVGLFQAASALSGAMAGFVLDAMVADFLPRMVAVADQPAEMKELINQQMAAVLMMAVPTLVGMMIFAPEVIRFFYAKGFEGAVPVVRWCTLGVLLRVLGWPLSIILQAKGAGRWILGTEVARTLLNLVALAALLPWMGLPATGASLVVSGGCYVVGMLWLSRRWLGWAWTRVSVWWAVGSLLAVSGAAGVIFLEGRFEGLIYGKICVVTCCGVLSFERIVLRLGMPHLGLRSLGRHIWMALFR